MNIPPLSPMQKEYISLQWRLLRQANAKAADFSRKWNVTNEAVEDHLNRAGVTDIVQRAKVKRENLTLAGYMDAWSFWEREAKRIHAAISGEMMCMQLLAPDITDRLTNDLFPG
jgi:hypothetical protein